MDDKHGYEISQILQEMRSDYWRNLELVEDGQSGDSRMEYLIVRCNGKRYGLPAMYCREVLKLPTLVRVPRLPVHLRGIFNLRGEIVAVTDPGPLLGQEIQNPGAGFRLVVVENGPLKTALLVEVVEGLSSVAGDRIEPLAEGAGAGIRDLVSGKLVDEEEVLILIDLARLLERPELIVDQKEQSEANP